MQKFFTSLILIVVFSMISHSTHAQILKKVLFEKYTSAKCGNCPDGSVVIKNITDTVDNVIWVSHHSGWIQDVMGFPTIDTIAMAFTSGAPRANVDRIKFQNESEVATSKNNWASHIQQQLATMAIADVQLNGSYDPSTRVAQLDVTTYFGIMPTPGDFRINVFIVEDSVTGGSAYDQNNYFNNTPNHPLNGAGNPIVGYPHRHVVRDVITGAWGLSGVIPQNPMVGTNYSQSFTYTLPNNYDENLVRFVAFVSYHDANVNNRQVLNANELRFREVLTVNTANIEGLGFKTKIFPNPVNDNFAVAVNTDTPIDLQITLINVNGQLVKDFGNYTITGNEIQQFDISDLPKGVYILNLNSTQGRDYKKIIKQ